MYPSRMFAVKSATSLLFSTPTWITFIGLRYGILILLKMLLAQLMAHLSFTIEFIHDKVTFTVVTSTLTLLVLKSPALCLVTFTMLPLCLAITTTKPTSGLRAFVEDNQQFYR
ncbi:hypothetical protein QOT17_020755 [Balamuthia mandrillaris]